MIRKIDDYVDDNIEEIIFFGKNPLVSLGGPHDWVCSVCRNGYDSASDAEACCAPRFKRIK